MHFKESPFLKVPTQKIDIVRREGPNGVIYLKSTLPLEPHPWRMTGRLLHWAETAPERVFLGQRKVSNEWETISYRETYVKVKCIGQWLLDQNVSAEKPVAILSENNIEHGLLALASLHVGIPYSSISPLYATKSSDLKKLIHVIKLLSPGILLVSDGKKFEKALRALSYRSTVVYIKNAPPGAYTTCSFNDIINTQPKQDVERAFDAVLPDTVAKILFTSGSTDLPKGVINTHNNITTNWQQIVQVFPFMENGFELIDWLPWNHTFGGNHNFGLTLYNGGSLYIDDGNATPNGIRRTVENIGMRNPSIYFNVPSGFEQLIPHLKADESLRHHFFKDLKMLFYAGAGMAQHIWDELEDLAFQTTGKRILIGTGLGCTEASPSAMFNTCFGSFAGMVGVPVPGLELKLVPIAGKLEVRYRGENIMPGYWRNKEATHMAFDEEGFYKTGDALKFYNSQNPNKGLIFDGRITEDFKLNTGTWVNVGSLRKKFIETGKGLIQDVVITGHDRAYLGAIVFPEISFIKNHFNLSDVRPENISNHPKVLEALQHVLNDFAKNSSGLSTFISKALIAPFHLSAKTGEITGKGTVNQQVVLSNRKECVEKLYSNATDENILEVYASHKHNIV